MTTYDGSELLAHLLTAVGVSAVFTVPGNHSIRFLDVLADLPAPFAVAIRQEQSGAFMADGFARAGGGMAAVLSCAGPGALNTVTATNAAAVNGSPFLNLITAPDNAVRGWELGYVHEFPEQLSAFRQVAAARLRTRSTADLARVLPAAVDSARRTRRPAVVEIPIDTLTGTAPADLVRLATARWTEREAPPPTDPADVADLAARLTAAEQPLIIAGRGAAGLADGAQLARLAERYAVPVIVSLSGRGSIDEMHPYAFGYGLDLPSVRALVADADLLLVLGCRLGAATTGGFSLTLPPATVQVDHDPEVLGATYPHVERIRADVGGLVRSLLDRSGADGDGTDTGGRAGWIQRLQMARETDLAAIEVRAPAAVACLRRLSAVLPADTVLVNDVTTLAYWGWYHWRVRHPSKYLYPTKSVTLGFGLPAGIGAALAGRGPVVVLAGDGGIGYCLSELSTAAGLGLDLVVVVINDAGYGLFRHRQRLRFKRTNLVDLPPVDYAAVARAHGITGHRVVLDELADSVLAAVDRGGPVLIEVATELTPPFDS